MSPLCNVSREESTSLAQGGSGIQTDVVHSAAALGDGKGDDEFDGTESESGARDHSEGVAVVRGELRTNYSLYTACTHSQRAEAAHDTFRTASGLKFASST